MIIRVSELEDEGLRIDDVEALAGVFSDPSWRPPPMKAAHCAMCAR